MILETERLYHVEGLYLMQVEYIDMLACLWYLSVVLRT